MFATLESRWFFAGDLPAKLEEYLGKEKFRNEQSTDRYLLLPNMTRVGIKLRGSSLEIKWLEGARTPIVLAERVRGSLGAWRKVALPIGLAEDLNTNDDLWVSIAKRRRTRVFGVTGDGRIVIASEPEFPEKGCRIECSNLCAAGRKYWTVCIDAFGGGMEMLEFMRRVAVHESHFLKATFLNEGQALDYPEWLCQTKRDARGDLM